jgi:hypothetical protein
VEHWESGFQLWHQPVSSGVFAPPDPGWIFMLEKLLFIQEKVRVPFAIPENISIQDIQTIYETAYKLEFGKMEPKDININGEKELAKGILNHFDSGQPFFCRLQQENEIVEVLNNPVSMGPVRVTIHNGYLSKDDLAALRKAVEDESIQEPINISFKSYDDRPIIVEYLKWLPPLSVKLPKAWGGANADDGI